MAKRRKFPDQRPIGDPGSDGFQVDRYPFYLLNRALGRYNAVILSRLRAIDLDIPNWRVLMVLGEHSPRGIGQISEASVIKLATMMRILQRMTDAGLVSSAPSTDDARVTNVSLTDAGRVKLAQARSATAPVYAAAIKSFSAADFDRLIALLGRLHNNLAAIE